MPSIDPGMKRSFGARITDVTVVPPAASPVPDTFSLTAAARAALNYLRGNPEPTRGYECRFTLGPLGIPCHHPEWARPNGYAYDPISLGDTDSRMDMQYAHMREMAGEPDACPVERGMRSRVLGYLGAGDYSWVNPVACVGHAVSGRYISPWTTAKLLCSLSETWQREGDEDARRLARRIFVALRNLAQWDGDRAWYMGIAPYRDGEWLMDGWCRQHGRNYPFIVEPLVRYWECTGDEEALELARAFTEGFLAGSQPDMGSQRVDPETGAFTGHVHLHTHAAWGVAHLGALVGERRYLEWAGRVHDFVLSQGTDYGWYPEFVPQGACRTEVCVVGDMVSLGAWLARGLSPDYWDVVERTVRNELRRSQFFLTRAFVSLFEELHRDKPALVVDEALRELRRLEGGFVAQATFDDWVSYPGNPRLGAPGIANNGIHMMGCCPPEGMRGLWEAWRGVVDETNEGVFINLAVTRDHPAARVTAWQPCDGRCDVLARRFGTYFLRPPAWASREGVRLAQCDRERTVEWGGPGAAYVAVPECSPGDILALTWPVPRFAQVAAAASVPEGAQQVTVMWCGNEVIRVEPRGQYLPMFS